MASLEQEIDRASTLARLDRIIDSLARNGHLASWSRVERDWFAAFLNPFASDAPCHRLSSTRSTRTSGLLFSSVLEDLVNEQLPTDELLAIIRLSQDLLSQETFDQDDDRRVLRLAQAMRRFLIDEPTRPGSYEEQVA